MSGRTEQIPPPIPRGGGDKSSRAGRLWPLLFPCAYLLHLVEEVWGGPGFVTWAARHLSPGFTADRFLVINVVAWPAMLIVSLAAIYLDSARWLVATLATILVVNGLLHLGSTAVTASYSPGVISGVLAYLPLGAFTLRRVARDVSPAKIGLGIALGMVVHVLVILAAFGVHRYAA